MWPLILSVFDNKKNSLIFNFFFAEDKNKFAGKFFTNFFSQNNMKCMQKKFYQNQSKKNFLLWFWYTFFAHISNNSWKKFLRQKNCAGDFFGLNHPSQQIIENHWLAFLNEVWKNLLVPETWNLNFVKHKKLKKKIRNFFFHTFQNITHALGEKMLAPFGGDGVYSSFSRTGPFIPNSSTIF